MKEIIVLGIARSGTSMTTAIVDALGVEMNGSREKTSGCPEGNFEDAFVTNLSSDIVNNRVSRQEGEGRLIEHIKKRRLNNVDWGFKATLLHFMPDLFIRNLSNIHFVVVFRNPVSNAESLVVNIKKMRGNEVSFESQMRSVTSQANTLSSVLKEFNSLPRIYTTYELIKKDCLHEAGKIADFLGIRLDQEKNDKIKKRILTNYSTIC